MFINTVLAQFFFIGTGIDETCFSVSGNPQENQKSTTDPYKTLFVARIVSTRSMLGRKNGWLRWGRFGQGVSWVPILAPSLRKFFPNLMAQGSIKLDLPPWVPKGLGFPSFWLGRLGDIANGFLVDLLWGWEVYEVHAVAMDVMESRLLPPFPMKAF